MPPKKAKGSAKADAKKKEKIIEDKTFGLKNKNRSKAVQKYVQTVQTNMKGAAGKKQEMEKEKKKMDREEKKQKELELKKMYGGIEEKKATEDSAAAAAAAERGEYLWTADDFEEIETDDTRLEEQLEAEREALVGRTDLTPVNEESFKVWWANNREQKAKALDKAQKSMIKKFKQTGRGISGRALFEHDATIFVDDADAHEAYEREPEEGEGDAAAEDEALFDGEDLPEDDE